MKERVWWVNQGGTYGQERAGGYLWAPIRDARGVEPAYWKTMAEVRKGDLVLHCAKGTLWAISRATSEAYAAVRPADFPPPSEAERMNWDRASKGRRIDVEHFDLRPPIALERVANKIAALGLDQGPLNKNHQPKQSYLHRFSAEGLRILREVSSGTWPDWAQTAVIRDRP